MKKIIIALDYDPSAEKVALAGYEIAKALHAEVILLHVVGNQAYYASGAYSPIMGFTGFDGPMIEGAETSVITEAKRFLEEARKHLGDETIELSVVEGEVEDAINAQVKNLNADMVVMGTHARHGLDKLLMGNIAAKVLNNITVPLVAVPTHGQESSV